MSLRNPDNEFIETFTGKKFWPFQPERGSVDIIDIAHALSMKCRFTGHTIAFYSVAQHSVAVAKEAKVRKLSPGLQLQALLHDASEAYLPDVAKPIKHLIKGFVQAEDELMKVISKKIHFSWPMSPKVKEIDFEMLTVEAEFYMRSEGAAWPSRTSTSIKIEQSSWGNTFAEGEFLLMYRRLQEQIAKPAEQVSRKPIHADECRCWRCVRKGN